mmetsp:Transcript_18929/g.48139  ORF Transcript_18929/g.48139 Transcript_18929/m.48139 type:complete len:226 (+) Transcript_18929:101-778(+)
MRTALFLLCLVVFAVANKHGNKPSLDNDLHMKKDYTLDDGNKRYRGTEMGMVDAMPTRPEAWGFKLIRPEGRGVSESQNTVAPCGQYRGTMPLGERIEGTTDDFMNIDVLIKDANGGGVITEYFGYGPDPAGPLFHDWHNQNLRFVVPDEDNKMYRIKIRMPPQHLQGPGTIQLVFNSIGRDTQGYETDAKTYFQCIDVIMDSPASVLSASVSVAAFALLSMLLL